MFGTSLALMSEISLPGYHLLPAARADLLRRLGRFEDAARAYEEALTCVSNDRERRFLEKRLAEARASIETRRGGRLA